MSKKVLSADNQQERSTSFIHPWYITGFVEGEGTFHIAIYEDIRMKQRIKIIPEFHVNQSHLRSITLETIKRYFNCGYIKANHKTNERDSTLVYVVRNNQDLREKIIPFFKKYPLLSKKRDSFQIFARIVQMMSSGKHLTESGVKKIIDLAYKMNVNGKYRTRKKEEVLKKWKSSETIR